MKRKKALVLAGGFDQIALIEELKSRHYDVVLVDYFENPPAKFVANRHYQASTLDIDQVMHIAMIEKVDLVTTACTDQALLTASEVSERLNLFSYLTYKQSLDVTNKMHMKKVMLKSNIRTSKFEIVNDASGFQDYEFKYPLVVKPTDCNSSKGVIKVNSFREAEIAIKDAIELSRINTAIIEEFIEGKEISVDVFIKEGLPEVLLITESLKIADTKGFTIVKSNYPVSISSSQMIEIKETIKMICDSFNLSQGPLLVQMLVNDSGVYVIEFSARMGGGSKYKLIEELTGFNIMKAYVDLVTEKEFIVEYFKKVNYASITYCYVEKGVFSHLENFDDLVDKGIISTYFKYKPEGTYIDKSTTSSDRIAGYLITADSLEDLVIREEYANKNLKIISDENKDIMKHMLSYK